MCIRDRVTIKLQFIGNENPFKDSSAGVQFFSSSQLSPRCFIVQSIIGFVADLVVEDNPENTWHDYFLKGNKSSTNDSRLKVLYNLSAEVNHWRHYYNVTYVLCTLLYCSCRSEESWVRKC